MRVAQKVAAGQLDMLGLAIVIDDDHLEMWRTPVNISKKA